MCGIFGVLIGEGSDFSYKLLRSTINNAFRLSESRGKEASGVAIRAGQSLYVLKEPIAATRLIDSKEFNYLFNNITMNELRPQNNSGAPLAVLGHSRLVTNGQGEFNSNNQPVVKDGAVGIHNGIIVNDINLWKSFPALKRNYEVDTEVFLSLLQMFRGQNLSLTDAAKKTFAQIQGSASVAVLFEDTNLVLLATNTGSLYLIPSRNGDVFVFASEKYILKQIVGNGSLINLFDPNDISQVKAGTGYAINLINMRQKVFSLNGKSSNYGKNELVLSPKLKINEIVYPIASVPFTNQEKYKINEETRKAMIKTWEQLYSGEVNLKRCTKCLLSETVPYINFDEDGICNYCRSYVKRGGNKLKGEDALRDLVSKFKNNNGDPDCIVGFSGGRDSTYGLDYLKNVLGMNPITFTYDWGMVVDLARRNQARVSGKLGIENILVSANIKEKRENIRKNLEAWLKKPELGMVPLLMAGDKQFYYYFHKIRKQTGIKLFIFCGGHEIEETAFKYGFCGIDHGVNNVMNRLTGISVYNKLKLIGYYAKQYLRNPAYINKSILDTFFAYYSTYILPDDYLYLYHYIEWDEKEIISHICEKFDWELAHDTVATWRTDDGTAAFYNYIYLTITGFTEFDNFRSYQIREGKLARDEALELIKEENKPRFESIEWYAQAVGFDLNRAITIINSVSKLYPIK